MERPKFRILTSSFAKLKNPPGLSEEDLMLLRQENLDLETINKIRGKYPNNRRAQGQISVFTPATESAQKPPKSPNL